ncbi:hypothetical protein [Micromonospora sp. NPDC001898]|uniref:hypothetical protein n=1 Tax=Micromonospora sp. NPDC001898 TaxID=3364221 RepID=UPI00369A0C8A
MRVRVRVRVRVALGLAVAGLLAGPVAVLGVHVLHPRDEGGYLAYLTQYGDPSSDAPVPVLPPAGDLIAEGDAACSWMRGQPHALWRADSQYHFQAVLERYLRHVADRPLSWGGAVPKHSSVTVAAWAYLCPADWELRQPRRRPFAPPPD